MIDLQPSELVLVRDILRKHVPSAEVRVFGSRITGKTKNHSDLDLVIVGKTAVDSPVLSMLKTDFEESDLPFRVDILDWHSISERFQKKILEKYEVLPL